MKIIEDLLEVIRKQFITNTSLIYLSKYPEWQIDLYHLLTAFFEYYMADWEGLKFVKMIDGLPNRIFVIFNKRGTDYITISYSIDFKHLRNTQLGEQMVQSINILSLPLNQKEMEALEVNVAGEEDIKLIGAYRELLVAFLNDIVDFVNKNDLAIPFKLMVSEYLNQQREYYYISKADYKFWVECGLLSYEGLLKELSGGGLKRFIERDDSLLIRTIRATEWDD